MIPITRYNIKNEKLTPYVKFIWHLDNGDDLLTFKLLPTDCIDLIFTVHGIVEYRTGKKVIHAPNFHINGFRDIPSYISHTGKAIEAIGISFYSFGLYPFTRRSLKGKENQIIDFFSFSQLLAYDFSEALSNICSMELKVSHIEKILLKHLEINQVDFQNIQAISQFMDIANETTVHSFCQSTKMNIKTFERMTLRYTGYTPKKLSMIKRFQSSANQFVHGNNLTLLNIVYDNKFTDQAHFNKEFKRFSENSPTIFRQQNKTIKENAKYSYK